MMSKGGYRHVRGGGPRVQLARQVDVIDWYLDYRHYAAAASDPHPDLLCLRCVPDA